MKNAVSGIIFVLLGCLSFFSCDKDEDNRYEEFYHNIVTVVMDDDDNSFYLVTDKGNKLMPTDPTPWFSNLKDGGRGTVLFNILGGAAPQFLINLISFDPVLTKPVWTVTPENADTAVIDRKDPGLIIDAWYTYNTELAYVTVVFKTHVFAGAAYVNLVQDNTVTVDGVVETTPVENPTPDGVWNLNFITKYSADNLVQGWTMQNMASFIVDHSLIAERKVEKIALYYYDMSGALQVYDVTLKDSVSNLYDVDFGKDTDNASPVGILQ